ncbi:hypothetical protein DDT56_22410 [Brenneria corticis]|uniref:Uncharacterized protein n=1 Tax=Brenneria corticis TaxID=2173106 RepID=A0A2U1TL31_9GAMM|nr:hypothetical protein DDT56_22410 [Brenneria sp. CFCC 11842]
MLHEILPLKFESFSKYHLGDRIGDLRSATGFPYYDFDIMGQSQNTFKHFEFTDFSELTMH